MASQSVSANAIVAGSGASISQAPWQVALVNNRASSNYAGQFCGGTIISREWIVTAAHCVDWISSNQISVLSGTNQLSNSSLSGSSVESVIIHPNWNSYTNQNDIALVKLDVPLILQTGLIEKVSVSATKVATGADTIISGWGSTIPYRANENPISNKPSQLQIARIQVQSNSYCGYLLDGSFDAASMICATNSTFPRIDTCQGDSGGPLVVYKDGQYELAGITSFGFGCADIYPGVYTNVSTFSSWISRNAIPTFEPPTITQLSATDLARGATVTVTGTGFSATARSNIVKVGTVTASVLTTSETSLSFKIPAKAVLGANTLNLTVSGITVSENLTIFNAPIIKSIAQSTSYVGGTVVINGSGFSVVAEENQVNFAGASEPAQVLSATAQTLTVMVPEGAISAKLNLTVHGTSVVSPKVLKISLLPEINGLSSESVSRGGTLVITGINFAALAKNNQIKVGSSVAKVLAVSGGTITFTVPAKTPLGSTLVTLYVDGLSASTMVNVTN